MADAQGGLARPGSLLPRPEKTCRVHSARSPQQLSSVPSVPAPERACRGRAPRTPAPARCQGTRPARRHRCQTERSLGHCGSAPGAIPAGSRGPCRGCPLRLGAVPARSGELLGGWSSSLPSPARARPISARQVGSARRAAARAPAAARREARASQHFPWWP